ncbi:MAG: hypothetical protein LBM27_00045, partial [Lactobacillaceae bacterium]|nr:hypothetical protein [Lactobacillaceae bacterium]
MKRHQLLESISIVALVIGAAPIAFPNTAFAEIPSGAYADSNYSATTNIAKTLLGISFNSDGTIANDPYNNATLLNTLVSQSKTKDGNTLLNTLRKDGSKITLQNLSLGDLSLLSIFDISDNGTSEKPGDMAKWVASKGQGFFGIYSADAWKTYNANNGQSSADNNCGGGWNVVQVLMHAAYNVQTINYSGLANQFVKTGEYTNMTTVLLNTQVDNSYFPNLMQLNLSGTNLGDTVGSGQTWPILSSKTLMTLDLSNTNMTVFGSGVSRLSSGYPSLVKLDISDNPKL